MNKRQFINMLEDMDLHMFDYRGLIPRGLANTKIIS